MIQIILAILFLAFAPKSYEEISIAMNDHIVIDSRGHIWDAGENLHIGSKYQIEFCDMGTDEITDDVVLTMKRI